MCITILLETATGAARSMIIENLQLLAQSDTQPEDKLLNILLAFKERFIVDIQKEHFRCQLEELKFSGTSFFDFDKYYTLWEK